MQPLVSILISGDIPGNRNSKQPGRLPCVSEKAPRSPLLRSARRIGAVAVTGNTPGVVPVTHPT
jgi:hypothetical protein